MTVTESGEARTLITAAGTVVVKNRAGMLGRLIIGTVGTSMTVDIYDDPATTNNKIYSWVTADGKVSLEFGCPMINGITVVVGGTPGNVVITWA